MGPVADLAAGRVQRVVEPEDGDAREEPVVGGVGDGPPHPLPERRLQRSLPDERPRVVVGVGVGEVGEPVPGPRVATGLGDPRDVGVDGGAQPDPVVLQHRGGPPRRARAAVVGGTQRGLPGVAQRAAVRDRQRQLAVEREAAGVRHPPRREVARLRAPVHDRQPGLGERPAGGEPHRACHVAAAAGPRGEDEADLGRVPAQVDGAREPRAAAVLGLDRPAGHGRAVLAGLGDPFLGVRPLVRVRNRGVPDRVRVAAHHDHLVDVVGAERPQGDDAIGALGGGRGHTRHGRRPRPRRRRVCPGCTRRVSQQCHIAATPSEECHIAAMTSAVARARDLLAANPLVDGHNDLPWALRMLGSACRPRGGRSGAAHRPAPAAGRSGRGAVLVGVRAVLVHRSGRRGGRVGAGGARSGADRALPGRPAPRDHRGRSGSGVRGGTRRLAHGRGGRARHRRLARRAP